MQFSLLARLAGTLQHFRKADIDVQVEGPRFVQVAQAVKEEHRGREAAGNGFVAPWSSTIFNATPLSMLAARRSWGCDGASWQSHRR